MTRTICITGPESTGKSDLSRNLSLELQSPWVPEFARDFLLQLNRPYKEADLKTILHGQLDSENLARQKTTAPFLFIDTGPEVLYIWSLYKYNRVSQSIQEAVAQSRYDLTLLLAPDLPWSPDPLRENRSLSERNQLFSLYKDLLHQTGRNYEIVTGQDSLRIRRAKEILRQNFPIVSTDTAKYDKLP